MLRELACLGEFWNAWGNGEPSMQGGVNTAMGTVSPSGRAGKWGTTDWRGHFMYFMYPRPLLNPPRCPLALCRTG